MPRYSATGSASAVLKWRRCAPKGSFEATGSARLARPVTRGDVDLVDLVSVSFGFAEDRAMAALEIDPCDGELVFLGAAAEGDGDRVADRDPSRQGDVLIRFAGAGYEPFAAFGQLARAARLDGLDTVRLPSGGRSDRSCGEQQARNPGSQ